MRGAKGQWENWGAKRGGRPRVWKLAFASWLLLGARLVAVGRDRGKERPAQLKFVENGSDAALHALPDREPASALSGRKSWLMAHECLHLAVCLGLFYSSHGPALPMRPSRALVRVFSSHPSAPLCPQPRVKPRVPAAALLGSAGCHRAAAGGRCAAGRAVLAAPRHFPGQQEAPKLKP